MLVYHPAFDNYHCMVRLLKILNNIPILEYSLDRIVIYDYFFLFPTDLKKTVLPTSLRHIKRLKDETRFNKIYDSSEVFKRISGFQHIALHALASFELIDNKLFKENIILRTEKHIPLDLSLREIEKRYIDFLNIYANKISLKELKERTKLMEFRYELS